MAPTSGSGEPSHTPDDQPRRRRGLTRLIGLGTDLELERFGRRWGIIAGLMLLVGLIWPIASTSRTSWNGPAETRLIWGWEVLETKNLELIFLFLGAVLVGLLGIIAGATSKGVARARTLTIPGVLLVVNALLVLAAAMVDPMGGGMGGSGGGLGGLFGGVAQTGIVIVLTFALAFTLMLIGTRLTVLFPDHAGSRTAASLGGFQVLAAFLIVVIHPLMKRKQSLDVVFNFETQERTVVSVMLLLLLVATMLAMLLAAPMNEKARQRMGSVVIILCAALIVGSFGQQVAGIVAMGGGIEAVGTVLKFWLIGVSLFLLPACGTVDWVAHSVARSNQHHRAFAQAHRRRERGKLEPPRGSRPSKSLGVSPTHDPADADPVTKDVLDLSNRGATNVRHRDDVIPEALEPVGEDVLVPTESGGVSVPAVIEPPAVEQPGTTEFAPPPGPDATDARRHGTGYIDPLAD